MNPQYPGLMRIHKRLSTGERVAYLYHRPTRRRLYSEPGTDAFEVEYAEAVRMGLKRRGRGGFQPTPGTVYFVAAESVALIKIGRTGDVRRRMNALRVASPVHLQLLATIEDPAGTLERELHRRFADLRAHGEWFRADAAIHEFLAARSPSVPHPL